MKRPKLRFGVSHSADLCSLLRFGILFPGGSDGKASAYNAGNLGLIPGKISWRRKQQPTPVFLAWKIPWMEEHGGLQSMGSQESDTTEQLHFLSFTFLLLRCLPCILKSFDLWGLSTYFLDSRTSLGIRFTLAHPSSPPSDSVQTGLEWGP